MVGCFVVFLTTGASSTGMVGAESDVMDPLLGGETEIPESAVNAVEAMEDLAEALAEAGDSNTRTVARALARRIVNMGVSVATEPGQLPVEVLSEAIGWFLGVDLSYQWEPKQPRAEEDDHSSAPPPLASNAKRSEGALLAALGIVIVGQAEQPLFRRARRLRLCGASWRSGRGSRRRVSSRHKGPSPTATICLVLARSARGNQGCRGTQREGQQN
jgi:hypothetical protein